ncbi:hypothetical protein DL771_000647 [Monosporascus sp. 5C6A]|nr:hypothetical protein DL771_000647 [Monosporascus sp. 5C6A]
MGQPKLVWVNEEDLQASEGTFLPQGYLAFEEEDRLQDWLRTPEEKDRACWSIWHLCHTRLPTGQVVGFETFDGLCKHERRRGPRPAEITALLIDIDNIKQRSMESLHKFINSERVHNAHLIFEPFEHERVKKRRSYTI